MSGRPLACLILIVKILMMFVLATDTPIQLSTGTAALLPALESSTARVTEPIATPSSDPLHLPKQSATMSRRLELKLSQTWLVMTLHLFRGHSILSSTTSALRTPIVVRVASAESITGSFSELRTLLEELVTQQEDSASQLSLLLFAMMDAKSQF